MKITDVKKISVEGNELILTLREGIEIYVPEVKSLVIYEYEDKNIHEDKIIEILRFKND